MVATGPRPTSRRDSMIGPDASAFGLAVSSSSASATRSTFSSKVVEALALFGGDRGELGRAAPLLGLKVLGRQLGAHAVDVRVGQVDLVHGDHDRHLGRACVRDRLLVCGITPSSAATTRTAMSVTFAPRARMAVNASWPGVSRKVIFRSVVDDLVGADVLRDPTASVSTTPSCGSRRAASSCRGRRGP
jgi:hypothetical protein